MNNDLQELKKEVQQEWIDVLSSPRYNAKEYDDAELIIAHIETGMILDMFIEKLQENKDEIINR